MTKEKGFLFLSIIVSLALVGYFAFAWTEPGSTPPGGNVDTPLNVGSTAQTKTGDLTLPGLYLNAVGNEGSIYNADIIQGYNDLRLFGNSAKTATIWLDSPTKVTKDFTAQSGIILGGVRRTSWPGETDLNGWSFGNDYLYDDSEEVIRASDEWLRLNQAGHFTSGVYSPGKIRADGGFQVDGYEMVSSNADKLYANRKNTTGGGIWISDDGGFYDYNNAYIDFRGSTGIRILESDGSWGNNSIRAANLCIQNDCRSSWPAGGGTPPGGIIMYSGAWNFDETGKGTGPLAGWALCNGNNGTPNLSDRFVMGTISSPTPGATGGTNSYSLSTAQLPSHTHTFTTNSAGSHSHTISIGSGGSHSHSISINSAGTHTHGYLRPRYFTNYQCSCFSGTGSQWCWCGSITGTTYSSGSHTHSASVSTAGYHTHSASASTAGSHTHSGTTNSTGSGSSIDNRPAFIKLAFIMKL